MNSLINYKTALISGASSGIGRAVAHVLAESGVNLILLARREEKLIELAESLTVQTKCHVLACDLTNTDDLELALSCVPDEFMSIDVLVNCAGAALGLGTGQDSNWQDWQSMIDLNCTGLAFLTHKVLPAMVGRNCGHIVNIGSIAGTYPYKGGNIYGATKAFVEQLTLNLKSDLLGTAVRVSNIEPGMVSDSEFSLVRFGGDEEKVAGVYEGIEALSSEDVANAVKWVLAQPPHVNVNRIEIMPVNQAPARTDYSRNK
jgi:NADP-dependent 3-hydroxy acid dehydrogenase YdfG